MSTSLVVHGPCTMTGLHLSLSFCSPMSPQIQNRLDPDHSHGIPSHSLQLTFTYLSQSAISGGLNPGSISNSNTLLTSNPVVRRGMNYAGCNPRIEPIRIRSIAHTEVDREFGGFATTLNMYTATILRLGVTSTELRIKDYGL